MILERLNNFFSRHNKFQRNSVILFLTVVIGLIDSLTGYELSLAVLYLIPIGLSAWYASPRFARLICVVATGIWLIADLLAGHFYTSWIIVIWNVIVRFISFWLITDLLQRLRISLNVLESLATHDGLTGIMNIRAFKAEYATLSSLAKRYDHTLAIAFLDLDGFKQMNDTFGHSVGDDILKEVAQVISATIRNTDCVARLGGDEFAMLLPETSFSEAQTVLNRVHQELVAITQKNRWQLGFSIGVAVFAHPPSNYDTAIGIADRLMYKVKTSGKNAVMFEAYSNDETIV